MPHQQPARRSRLAWALLGLTVVLIVSTLAIAFTGGVDRQPRPGPS
jgi:hypothetical protein